MALPPWVTDLLGSSATTYRPPSSSGAGGVAGHLEQIRSAAGRYGLDPSLLAGVVDFESGGNAGAVNRSSGATGLGQVMPREAGFPDRPTKAELLDPETNLEWSSRILKNGLDRYGSEDKALAAYLGAIDARGNITGAVDANGTGGNQYIRTVRQRQQQYRGLTDVSPGRIGSDLIIAGGAPNGAPPWVTDLLASEGTPQSTQGTPSLNAQTDDLVDRGPRVADPQAQGVAAMRAGEDKTAPPWVRDLLSSDPSAFNEGGRKVGGTSGTVGGYEGPAQTDEVWPVAGHKWGQVNNPFGGTQARSAGSTVALPAYNTGADLTGSYGDDVVAPVSGTVIETFDAPNETDRNLNRGWGGSVVLLGDNGFTYRLSHLQPGLRVRAGTRVARGQQLGDVGVSGNTTGPHLDAEKYTAPGRFVDIVSGRGAGAGGTVASSDRSVGNTANLPPWVRDLLGAA